MVWQTGMESLWQKDSLVTLIFFELYVLSYLAQSQSLVTTLYSKSFADFASYVVPNLTEITIGFTTWTMYSLWAPLLVQWVDKRPNLKCRFLHRIYSPLIMWHCYIVSMYHDTFFMQLKDSDLKSSETCFGEKLRYLVALQVIKFETLVFSHIHQIEPKILIPPGKITNSILSSWDKSCNVVLDLSTFNPIFLNLIIYWNIMDYTRDESAIFTESKGQRQVKTAVTLIIINWCRLHYYEA